MQKLKQFSSFNDLTLNDIFLLLFPINVKNSFWYWLKTYTFLIYWKSNQWKIINRIQDYNKIKLNIISFNYNWFWNQLLHKKYSNSDKYEAAKFLPFASFLSKLPCIFLYQFLCLKLIEIMNCIEKSLK